ncbi:MAG: CDP-glycerol glycerophosphotransferase family protein [Jatrophihabitans sp.]|uniref:CDP-glycerol glycerophosphotransferase family protein n=1 Tax=Jatrophihabitans sp. TaxID=1932789 RepID=UPI0039112AC4
MAKFTFATGNVRGLRRIPLYLVGAVATLVVPRTDRIWVFGSGIGPGEGALPLYRLARERLGADVRLVWLATTPEELARARALGLDSELKLSASGLWLTMRARVQVVTHGQGDVNRYGARGGFLVQLWHGIPLKRLHLDSPAALTAPSRLGRLLLERGHRTVGRQVRIFAVSSERVVSRFASAFGLTREQILVSGDARDDVLLQGDPEGGRRSARELLESAVGPLGNGPVVMYAPTWREGDADPSQPDEATWRQIIDWLDRVDGTLVVRSHPLGVGDYDAGPALSPRVRLLDNTQVTDVNVVLPAVDHLVTDYSSMAYDYSLTGGTIVFLAADVTTYLESRGLYEPYHEFTGGRHVATWTHALQRLDALVAGDPEATAAAREHTRWLRDEHFDHLDGRAAERVLDAIVARTSGAVAAVEPAPVSGRPTVTRVTVEPDRLVLGLDAGATPIDAIGLDGPRGRVDGTPTADGAEFPLLVTRWGQAGLALPSGDYRLTLGGTLPSTRVAVSTPVLPAITHPLFRVEAMPVDGGLVVRIGPPLADDERGPAAQRALRNAHLRPTRRENAVYFESFYGRSASDNPRAIAAVLAREHPEVTQYWSVTDRSVAVPPGTVPLVEYSREWWRVRAAARLYVINDWLRWTYRKRGGQKVLQTWHGTMLKRLARDRDVSARSRFAALRQGWRWSALLAQNSYSAERFRTSYAYRGPIWETGYPRNDVLTDTDRAARVRELVGIAEGTTVVLYAPTWRDNRNDLIDALDLAEFAGQLPDDHVLLVRGHSRTIEGGADLSAERLIDVTTYPDVGELMLVADVLVTDYSSVMFDFVATDRPMIFYTPDLAHYSDVLRGFYFDFIAEAPGPIVETGADLLAALVEAETAGEKYAGRRASWRERFTPHDDGGAAERVVQRLYDEGWLG